MKKHNFDIHPISLSNINLGLCYSRVDLPENLFYPYKKNNKGYMIEIGIFFITFVYLYCPNSR